MKKMILLTLMVICFAKIEAQTIVNPIFDRTDTPSFHIDKIESSKDTTIIYCSVSVNNTWVNISPDTYVEDVVKRKKYHLIKAEGLLLAPLKQNYYSLETICAKLYFPNFHNVKKINLIEDFHNKSFNVFGVDLFHNSKKKYQDSDIKHLSKMSSFFESSGDSIKAIQYKKEEIEATKYHYGLHSDVTLFSMLSLCILYDKFGFSKESINYIQLLSKLHNDSWGENTLEYDIQNRTFSENDIIASQYDNIFNIIKDGIALYKKLNIVDGVYALLLRNLSDYYNLVGEEKNFLVSQKECLNIRREISVEKSYLEDLIIVLVRNTQPRNIKERIMFVEDEMKNLPKFVNTHSPNYVVFLKNLLDSYRIVNEEFKAENICNQILSILKMHSEYNLESIVEIMGEKCKILRNLGLVNETIQTAEKAKEIFDSLNFKSKTYRGILDDLAWSYNLLFNYEKAIALTKQIVDICKEEKDWLALANSLMMLGSYYKYKEDVDNADFYLNMALNCINSHDDVEEYLDNNIKLRFSSPNQSREAFVSIQKSISYIKIMIYLTLANVKSKIGNYEEAIKYEEKCGSLINSYLETEAYAFHLLSLSNYLKLNGQYDESNRCAEESIEFFKMTENPYLSNSYLQLAQNNYLKGNINSAIDFTKESIRNAQIHKDFEKKQMGQRYLAFFYLGNNEPNKAEKCMSEALDSLQNKIKKEILSMSKEQKQRLWSLNENGFMLYRRIVGDGVWNLDNNSKLFNYSLFSKSLLLDSDNSDRMMALWRMDIKWKNIQEKLSNKDIAIEFITAKEFSEDKVYYALVIDNFCEFPNLIALFKESDFKQMKQISQQTDMDILGAFIWKKILNQYNDIENIYFATDDILHTTPIENCYVDGIGEIGEHYNLFRLSSTKEIVFQNRRKLYKAALYGGLEYEMREIDTSKIKKENAKNFLRSVKERGGFEPLLYTIDEIKEICEILNKKNLLVTLYSGKNGTENSLKSLSGQDFSALHISTHGMYIDPQNVKQKKMENNLEFLELLSNEIDPVKEDIILTHSFLVMSGGNKLTQHENIGPGEDDGILTAFEISQLDLSKVDIVVLSACESGLGDIENSGVYGLQRGFKKSGANTILMSLDKVDDKATKILMVEFYRNMVNGKTKLQSLKAAQKYLRQYENGKYKDPKYWASFILLDGLN